MDFMKMTLKELSDGIKKAEFTSVEIVKSYFDRIESEDEKIQSYITVCREEALKQAEEADQKVKCKDIKGKLLGVPIAVKDNICTDGIRTTCASKMLEDFVPPYDAAVVEKLKEEGAVIIGKLNMDEFAMGSSTENSAYKITKNPFDIERVPGGSSGGSAAAVAACLAPAALGSDTGGSIRQPSSFCGVVGLKPTYGLVSRYGLIAFASSLDQIGPITRNVDDAAFLLSIIEGYDERDNTSAEIERKDYFKTINDGVKGMKIAVPKQFFEEGLDVEVKEKVLSTIDMLKELGAEVETISMEVAEEGLSAYYIISSAESSSNLARFDGIRYGYRTKNYEDVYDIMANSRSESFGDEVKRRIMIGTYCLSAGYYDAYYKKAMKLKKKIKSEFKKVFEKYDIIIGPVSPVLPFKIGEKKQNPVEMYLADIYTVNVNLAGIPAISVPCGMSSDELPIGMQIMADDFCEEKIFRAAKAVEDGLKLDMYEKMMKKGDK